MLETLKKLMDNLVSLFQKIKCSMSCCNQYHAEEPSVGA